MPIPTAVKYGRETCFSLSVANSQPPTESNLEVNNRPVINGSTRFFPQNALRKTRYAIPYGAVIADLGTPTTGQLIYPLEAVSARNFCFVNQFRES